MKTTFPFNDYLRTALKNAITKCTKSMNEKVTDQGPAASDDEELDAEADPSDEDDAAEESNEAEQVEYEEDEDDD